MTEPARRWREKAALLDDEEARRRLLDAARRCIERRGDAQLRMAEVADEAGVTRSTLYRYFATRDELILALLVGEVDDVLASVVRGLRAPDDAAASIPDLVLKLVALVETEPFSVALFAPTSRGFVSALELESEAMVDAVMRAAGPLLRRWQDDGQIAADLGLRETAHWLIAVGLVLLAPPWRTRTRRAKRRFLDAYVIRGILSR